MDSVKDDRGEPETTKMERSIFVFKRATDSGDIPNLPGRKRLLLQGRRAETEAGMHSG